METRILVLYTRYSCERVQLFRKEAIFRRMKHYSREAERSQARVIELERRFNTCQAGLAALEACWSQVSVKRHASEFCPPSCRAQLLGTIRTLVKPEDLPSLDKESEGESFSGPVHGAAY